MRDNLYFRLIQMFKRYKLYIIVSGLIVLSAGYYFYVRISTNFHPITDGEAYRSAQLSGADLENYIQQYNIRSVLNLRGSSEGLPWYQEEIKTSSRRNVVHYDIALSAEREPSPRDVQKLMEIFSAAPRPILIHCKAGADRSGLVAAMWKVVVDKQSKAEAEKQLSLKFGHISFGKTEAMDRFFRSWNPELN